MARGKKELNFEEAIKRLEEIAEDMDNNELSLEQSMKLFQEGVKLSELCNKKLDEAERKINTIIKNASGKLIEESFDIEEE